ncbi:hypothetical protein Nepgr_014487 [Nepenthes gracilis]|uniref:Uncharacterized protein n=1 Tax=Nepenthes gracilis TaxID=150966 RepID=A0AAD3XQC6_NEPGR|nr:hypothetical protein Nepgr_014487 [Nepenthes gracilis]
MKASKILRKGDGKRGVSSNKQKLRFVGNLDDEGRGRRDRGGGEQVAGRKDCAALQSYSIGETTDQSLRLRRELQWPLRAEFLSSITRIVSPWALDFKPSNEMD